MTLSLVTAPTDEPIDLHDLVDTDDNPGFGRIPADVEDAMVLSMITAARQHIESPLTGRALLTQTWDYTFDQFPCADTRNPWGAIYIPRPPLQSVTSIKYYDTDGVQQTLATSVYTVDAASTPGKITLAYGQSWPSIRCIPDAITIRYVAGWTSPDLIPEPIKHAVKLQAMTLYEHREQFLLDQTVNELPILQRLLAEYRVYGMTA